MRKEAVLTIATVWLASMRWRCQRRWRPRIVRCRREVLDRYCVSCHNQRLKTADLALDTLDAATIAAARRTLGEGRAQAADRRRCRRPARGGPTRPTYDALIASLEDAPRRRCGGAAESRRSGPASPESRRIRQRDSRSAGARRRRRRRCCRRTIPRTASTTSRTCWASRRRCWSAISSAARKISALAVGDPQIAPSESTYRFARTCRRTSTSRAAARHPRRLARAVHLPAGRRVPVSGPGCFERTSA